MPNFGNLALNIRRFLSSNSPALLTGVAVAGVASTAILAVKATPQAMLQLENAREEKGEDLTVVETVKETYLGYIPALAVGLVTITCIISSTAISTKRNAALVSLYALTDQGFREYQEKTREVVGKEKEEKIRAGILEDRMKRDPEATSEIVILDDESKVLMHDSISGRYFKQDIETVRQVINDLNELILNNQSFATLNQFWTAIGLERTDFGDQVGWTTDQLLNVSFATAKDPKGRPCLSLDFRNEPIKGYYASVF